MKDQSRALLEWTLSFMLLRSAPASSRHLLQLWKDFLTSSSIPIQKTAATMMIHHWIQEHWGMEKNGYRLEPYQRLCFGVIQNWRKFFSTFACVSRNSTLNCFSLYPFHFIHSKFTNVFGSSRLLGSLALSPPGLRRQENTEGAKVSLAKERDVSYLVLL